MKFTTYNFSLLKSSMHDDACHPIIPVISDYRKLELHNLELELHILCRTARYEKSPCRGRLRLNH